MSWRYKPAQERLSVETRSEIVRHAARMRFANRPKLIVMCVCGDPEGVHWSVGNRECRACDERGELDRCPGFRPVKVATRARVK